MINLIPPAGHKAIRTEYFMRVGATYCLLFAAVAILLIVALVPTYVLVRAQMSGAIAHEGAQEENADITQIENDVARTEAIIAELKNIPATPRMSTIIHEIEKSAPEGISFRNFMVGHVKDVLGPIQVEGLADRRENLVAFKQALEAHALFESASVPIADLARDRDVSFSMTIVLSPQIP